MSGIQTKLKELNIDLEKIENINIRKSFILLFNIIEEQGSDIENLRFENQTLRDENSRLKGEQPKPKIRSKNKKSSTDISSEKERKDGTRKKSRRRKASKKKILTIHQTKICKVDKNKLPNDAVFKGYEDLICQDIIITPDNIKFRKEIFYSKSMKKTYTAELPTGYKGDFGPGIKSLVLLLKYACNISQPKILEFFKNHKISISSGSISNLIIKKQDIFHDEKKDIHLAGLASSSHQQTDDTSARVNGENYYTHVLCNEYYTTFFTRKRKDRLTILDILRNFRKPAYLFNTETITLLKKMGVPNKIVQTIDGLLSETEYSTRGLCKLLKNNFSKLSKLHRTRIAEATLIAFYHKEIEHPIIKILVADDAPQFKLLTEDLALCWVHDGRHYKKLRPVVPYNVESVENFLKKYWKYYRKLLRYKNKPTQAKADNLLKEFDKLFSTKTGYNDLDKRIIKTLKKKNELLLVLKHPSLPLHNNEAELAARVHTRIRDVSLHTITKEGTESKDTFTSISQTAKKLGVNFYQYIFDRISGQYLMPSLADIIRSITCENNCEYSDTG